MKRMANLHTDLTTLLERHRASQNKDFTDLIADLQVALDAAGTPDYQYRNHPVWDMTWMDLDEAQVAIVLEHDHTVERRLVLASWENVTQAPA